MYLKSKEFAVEIYNKIKLMNLNLKLGIIQIGDNPASNKYIEIKKKKLEEVGFKWQHDKLHNETSEDIFINTIKNMSSNENIHGIIVQLPIKSNMLKYLDLIPQYKDVDGITTINQGYLIKSIASLENYIIPCTPLGVMYFINQYKIELKGKTVAIFGKSFLVGKPIATLLQNHGATVFVINKSQPNAELISNQADILISAMGMPNYITKDFIKENAFVIDIGVTEIDGKIYGDIHENAFEKTKFITGCKGGIGPLTVAFLLQNLVKCYKLANKL